MPVSATNLPVYMRVITHDTPFFASKTDVSPLFYLPYSYYVKVIGESDGYYHIECYGDSYGVPFDGFVPTDALFLDHQSVTTPYLNLKINTATACVLYLDSTLYSPAQYLFENRALTYYGELQTEQGLIYYVCYNNRLGYVKESDVMPFTVPNHPNELTFLVPENPPLSEPEVQEPTKDHLTLKLVIIGCLFLAGVVGLFIALKGKPSDNFALTYYDENDYE